jgi:hypothetical protein
MKATLDIMGKKYVGEGDTARDAIAGIFYTGFARSKALLTIGDKTVVLTSLQTMRLFSRNHMMRDIAVKQISAKF